MIITKIHNAGETNKNYLPPLSHHSSPDGNGGQDLIDRLTDSWLANQLAHFHTLPNFC